MRKFFRFQREMVGFPRKIPKGNVIYRTFGDLSYSSSRNSSIILVRSPWA